MNGNNLPKMDWQQVVQNGGPPCFARLDDEDGWFCGRAKRWEGHDGEHRFVSLEQFVTKAIADERAACAQIVSKAGEEWGDLARARRSKTYAAYVIAALDLEGRIRRDDTADTEGEEKER